MAHAGVGRDGLELERHGFEQRPTGFRVIVAKLETISMQRAWVQDNRAGKRVLPDIAMGLVEKLERDGHVSRIHIVDLADKGDIRRTVDRTGTQGCGDHPLKACPQILELERRVVHGSIFLPAPGPGV